MFRNLAALGFGITVAAIAYEIFAAIRLRTLLRRREDATAARPPVTILKPLAGVEAELYENLCSFVDQDYPEVQVIFGVADASDPAIVVAQRVKDRFPNADISLVTGGGNAYGNPKIGNLCAMMPQVKHGLLVIADADMRVDRAYLAAVVSAFADPAVGAATCLYCGVPVNGFASLLGAMYINEQFAPSVLVANAVEPLTYCFGSTMAVRRNVLDEIGGLAALGAHIGDDYLLGKRVSERGYRVALAPYVVQNIVHERDAGSLLSHELRWARTVAVQRPAGYGSLFVTQPLLCALLLLFIAGPSSASGLAVAAALASRAAVSIAAQRAFPGSRTALWVIPLRDALTAIVWIGGFFTRRVRWREQALSVERDGRLGEGHA